MNHLDSHHSDSHYATLGVSPRAGTEQIKMRYRELARQCHPDVTGGQGRQEFQRLTQAYNVLQDPQQRAQYDRLLQAKYQAVPAKSPARQPSPPAAVLRSPAMQRLLSEAEGDAFAEAGQCAEALASYRGASGSSPNPALEAKIARLESMASGAGQSDAPARPMRSVEPDAQPFWRRWFGGSQTAGQS